MFLRYLAAAACVLTLLVGCAGPDLPALPSVSLESFPENGRSEAAAILKAAESNPDDPNACGRLGMLLQAYGLNDTALTVYSRARGLDQKASRWAYYAGVVRAAQGLHEEAVADFDAALEVDPANRPALRRKGLSLLALQQLDEARETFDRALAADSNDAEARYGLGRVEAARGDPEEAIGQLQLAVELAPTFGPAHYALALALREAGRSGEAARHMQAYERYGQTGAPGGDPLMAAVSRLNVSPTLLLQRASEAEQAGDLDAAIGLTEQALQGDPELAQANINLLILYGRTGRFDEAEAQYRKALAAAPDRASVHYNYGVLAFLRDDYPAAKKAFQEAVDSDPNHAGALHNLGQMNEGEGRVDAALKLYRQALDAQPDHRLARYNLGRVLARKGRFDEAIAAIRQAAEPGGPDAPEMLFALAGVYAARGDTASAKRYAGQAHAAAEQFGQTELAEQIAAALSRLP